MSTQYRRIAALFALIALVSSACVSRDGAAEETSPQPEATATPEQPEQDQGGGIEAAGALTVYSGRNEELVGEVLAGFTEQTGIELNVRYGDTAELAATILEEGDISPADLYFAQDAGALGAIDGAGRFATLPDEVLDLVDDGFRSSNGTWIGVTGRARVLAYNTELLAADDVPDSVFDLTDGAWQGRVGWAPENGSFQSFVTAMRIELGEDVTRDWLEGIIANDPVVFPNNTTAVEGVGRGEADLALVNHYYLARFLAEDPGFPVANKYLPGDIGGLVNVAGVGVLDTSDNQQAAFALVRYLLGEDVQTFFGQVADALEFPLRTGIDSPQLPTITELDPPEVDLTRLEDLQGTLELLREVGAFA